MDPDRLAALEEERDFLLRSIADLDREHAAGDVDDDDHRTLRDDYTARAAEVMHAIEEGRAALPAKRPWDLRRLLAGAVVTVLAVVGISWWLTRSTAPDTDGAVATAADLCPPNTEDVNALLVDARTAMASDPSCALELFGAVLKVQPENVEARTYAGWVIAFDAMTGAVQGDEAVTRGQQALQLIDSAIQLDPGYVDAQCFAAIVEFRLLGDAQAAAGPLERCRAGELPASVAPLVEQLGAKIDAALADAPATTAPAG